MTACDCLQVRLRGAKERVLLGPAYVVAAATCDMRSVPNFNTPMCNSNPLVARLDLAAMSSSPALVRGYPALFQALLREYLPVRVGQK